MSSPPFVAVLGFVLFILIDFESVTILANNMNINNQGAVEFRWLPSEMGKQALKTAASLPAPQ